MKTSEDKTTSTTTLTQHSAWLKGERNSLEVISDAGDREINKGERRGAVHQPDKPVEDPDVAKATQDQGQTATTSTSIQSTSHHHPADMEMTTDPMRPSEDPADMTDYQVLAVEQMSVDAKEGGNDCCIYLAVEQVYYT